MKIKRAILVMLGILSLTSCEAYFMHVLTKANEGAHATIHPQERQFVKAIPAKQSYLHRRELVFLIVGQVTAETTQSRTVTNHSSFYVGDVECFPHPHQKQLPVRKGASVIVSGIYEDGLGSDRSLMMCCWKTVDSADPSSPEVIAAKKILSGEAKSVKFEPPITVKIDGVKSVRLP